MEEKFLATFYAYVLMWVKDGCPVDNNMQFVRKEGLCYNLVRFMKAHGHYGHEILGQKREMQKSFLYAGMDHTFPFNNGQYGQYLAEAKAGSTYMNAARIQWLEQHADPELMKGYKPEPRKEHGSFYL